MDCKFAGKDEDARIAEIATSILAGQCIAFVGAGFSAPVHRGWKELLVALDASRDGSRLGSAYIENADAYRLELAAQALRGGESTSDFEKRVKQQLYRPLNPKEKSNAWKQFKVRLKALQAIPFRSVVTTNFDRDLAGVPPKPENIVRALRSTRPVWTRLSDEAVLERSAVLKLHGQLGAPDTDPNPIVFSRRSYRERVHGFGGYAPMVAASLATSDVLFLGTSFTDAYLNELRASVLSWFESSREPAVDPGCLGCRMPVRWWAVMPDSRSELSRTMAHHDGIHVLSYEVRDANDHSGFDAILTKLAARASLTGLLGGRFENARRSFGGGRRKLWWLDDTKEGNDYGLKLLRQSLSNDLVETLSSPRELEERLQRNEAPLVLISRYGDHEAEFLGPALEAARRCDPPFPVVVFAREAGAAERRWKARSMGAVDYTHTWQDLFRVLAELFESEEERKQRLFEEPWLSRG